MILGRLADIIVRSACLSSAIERKADREYQAVWREKRRVMALLRPSREVQLTNPGCRDAIILDAIREMEEEEVA